LQEVQQSVKASKLDTDTAEACENPQCRCATVKGARTAKKSQACVTVTPENDRWHFDGTPLCNLFCASDLAIQMPVHCFRINSGSQAHFTSKVLQQLSSSNTPRPASLDGRTAVGLCLELLRLLTAGLGSCS